MPDTDLKFTYHGFNREDGQYGLHPQNQTIAVSFPRRYELTNFSSGYFIPCNPRLKNSYRVENCECQSCEKGLSVCGFAVRSM